MTGRKVIAILGLPGSGKTEAIRYLQEKQSWPKVYFGQVTFRELEARGLEVNEKNERMVREDLRSLYGEDYYAQEVVRLIEVLQEKEHPKNILVESLYSWTEYQVLKNRFGDEFVAVAIHAAPKVRYARLVHRAVRPLAEEDARSRDIAQLKRLDQGMPIALADAIIENDGSLESFHAAIDRVISRFFSMYGVGDNR